MYGGRVQATNSIKFQYDSDISHYSTVAATSSAAEMMVVALLGRPVRPRIC